MKLEQIKETLYGDPKKNKVKQWAVYVSGDTVVVEWGRVGGKLQTKDTPCTPKNIGKSNETTPEQQALLEAEAKWTKQYDNKLYRRTPEEAETVGELLPMLASKNPEKIEYPCDIQPKLDGVRCMVYLEEDEIKAISRQGKFYELHSKLKEEIFNLMLISKLSKFDGELYIHGTKLQHIVSYVRNTDKEEHKTVEFHIFDVPGPDPWYDRSYDLDGLDIISKSYNQKFVNIVSSFTILSEDELPHPVQDHIEEGYEGTMVRNLKGKYEFNHRSNDLIKVKVMQDSEALVTACREDKNGEGVLTCSWNYVEFDVKMKGSHETRLFSEQEKLIGQWINFTYQQLSEANKPIFPVGQYVRECDDNGVPLV